MLDLMRKHARSWIMKVLLGIIIIVFVLYFGSMSGRQKTQTVATIDGKMISVADVQREYGNLILYYEKMYGGSLNNEILKQMNLKQKALDNLIDQAVILKKAEQYRIKTTDEEVKALIMANPSFQANNVFNERAYQYALRSIKMSPEEFEAVQQKMITAAKLEELIADAVKITDQEVYDLYQLQMEKIRIDYMKLSPPDFAGRIKPTTAQLEEYYKANQSAFRIPDQVQIKYIAFLGNHYAPQVNIPPDDVQSYYDSHKSQWKTADGKVYPLSAVESKIVAELKQIAGMRYAGDDAKKAHDTIYQKENFDAYAAENKLKISTTDFFTAKNPPAVFRNVPDLANIVFGLEKNEMSRVISSDDGYYLFMLAAKKPAYTPAFKDVEPEVAGRYIQAEAQKLCSKEAEAIVLRLKGGESLQQISREKNININQSGFFSPRSPIPQVGFSPELSDALYQLSEKKPYGASAFLIDGNYVIIYFRERGAIDNNDFLKQKDALKNQLLRIKKMEAIRSWIDGNKAAMIKDGRLKLNKDTKDI
ncbi:MAG: SurA N-terminal domain-containing protein [Deltaproteobacteria bacterium]|nr:SurA N-terminal domain-containing protein [Deltaproteobacteria bacterium]